MTRLRHVNVRNTIQAKQQRISLALTATPNCCDIQSRRKGFTVSGDEGVYIAEAAHTKKRTCREVFVMWYRTGRKMRIQTTDQYLRVSCFKKANVSQVKSMNSTCGGNETKLYNPNSHIVRKTCPTVLHAPKRRKPVAYQLMFSLALRVRDESNAARIPLLDEPSRSGLRKSRRAAAPRPSRCQHGRRCSTMPPLDSSAGCPRGIA